MPDDAGKYAYRQWLVVTPKTPWLGHPAGSLLAFDFDAFLAGDRTAHVLFAPDERTALAGHSWTRHHLILETLADVATRIEVLTPGPEGWSRRPLADVPALSSATVTDTDPDVSDEYFLDIDGYLQPSTLAYGHIGADSEPIKQAPARFDARALSVRQFFATSADGTRVPYFVVGPAGQDRPGPALLYGYGGFRDQQTPGYNALTGRAWLARGGTYAVANIRGGSEYGPAWHRAALGANRVRAFEDFAAVAADLTARGITTPTGSASRAPATAASSWARCSSATRSSSVRSSRRCRSWTCSATTACSPGPPGSPSTGTPTAKPTGPTSKTSPRTTTSPRTGPTRPCC